MAYKYSLLKEMMTAWDLRASGQFIDMWFRVEDTLIGAHKIVVANKSNFLYQEHLLKNDIVDLFNITIPVCQAFLAIVYDVYSSYQLRLLKLKSMEDDLQLLNLLHTTRLISPSWDSIFGVLHGVIPNDHFVQYYKSLAKNNLNHSVAARTLLWPNIKEDTDIAGIGYMLVEDLLRNYPKSYSVILKYKVVTHAINAGLNERLYEFVDMKEYSGALNEVAMKFLSKSNK